MWSQRVAVADDRREFWYRYSGAQQVERSIGYNRIIVIDSIIDPENSGKIKRLGLEDIRMEGLFSHNISLYQLLKIAESAEDEEKEIEIYGICIASTEIGFGLSENIKKSAEELADELLKSMAQNVLSSL